MCSSNEPTRRGGLVLVFALALGGCAVGPDYRAPTPEALGVPAAWRQDASGEGITAQPDRRDTLATWWAGFGDPVLSGLVDEALVANRELAAAQARLAAARARRVLAGAERFPGLTASAARAHAVQGTDSTERVQVELDASWELDAAGGTRRALEAALADEDASAAALAGVQVSIAAETALAYVQLRALQARIAIAQANLLRQAETLQITEWRAQAGLTTELDVAQARTALAQTRASLPALERQAIEAEHSLDLLLARPPGSLHARLAAAADIPAPPAQAAIGIPADTLRQRPDVRQAERQLAAQTARVGEAMAARYPAFTLSGSIGAEAFGWNGLTAAGAATRSLALSVFATVFDAGRLRARVAVQTATQEEALASYASTVLNGLGEVENALAAVVHARRRQEALAIAAENARTAATLARDRYAAGIVDFQVVLDTERSELTVEDTLKTAEADRSAAFIQLFKALGGGWSPAQGQQP